MKHEMVINSLIGEGTSLRGEFDVKGVLRIDGNFEGIINGDGKILIGEAGVAKSDIEASVIIIGGIVQGNVIASRKVTILSTGKLIGDIKTPRLVIEEGTVFEGKCTVLNGKEASGALSNAKEIQEAGSELKKTNPGKELVGK
jgi:cytoskeletal protein CcmA (bactofilin family)